MIYILGDTHAQIEWIKSNNFYSATKYDTTEKILIIVGDFGFVWHENETPTEKLDYIAMQNMFDYTLFIDGNHENHERLATYPIKEWNGGKVGVIRDNILHLKRGEYYTINGKTFWCFGGGKSIDKPYRDALENKEMTRLIKYHPEGLKKFKHFCWWPQEEPTDEEIQHGKDILALHNNQADYILTHEAPGLVVSKLVKEKFPNSKNEDFFDWVLQNVKYKQWFCGHYHRNEYVEENKITFLYHNFQVIK